MQWLLLNMQLSLFKKPLLSYLGLNLVALAIIAMPSKAAAQLGSIVLVTGFVSFYSHLIMFSVVLERKEKNNYLLATLPLKLKSLTYYKINSLLFIFIIFWLFFLIAIELIVYNSPAWPAVSMAFYVFGFLTYLPAFAFILVVAFVTLSEGFTIFSLVVSNMIVTVILNYFPKIEFMQEGFRRGSMAESGIYWPPELVGYLTAEFLLFMAIVFTLYAIVYVKRPTL